MKFASRFSSIKAAYIVSAARTPIGSFMGGLSALKATDLGGAAIQHALKKNNIPAEQVNEVIMGNVVSAGIG
jgi:acetyl-CoA C-acetyltransferase